MAMAGSNSVRTGLRRCAALRFRLRMDGPRHASTGYSTSTLSCGWFLPLRPQSDVRRFCRRLDWPMDRFWPHQSKRNCSGRSCCYWYSPVCRLLRRTDAARKIRRRLPDLLPERASLVAAPPGLAPDLNVRTFTPRTSDRAFCTGWLPLCVSAEWLSSLPGRRPSAPLSEFDHVPALSGPVESWRVRAGVRNLATGHRRCGCCAASSARYAMST